MSLLCRLRQDGERHCRRRSIDIQKRRNGECQSGCIIVRICAPALPGHKKSRSSQLTPTKSEEKRVFNTMYLKYILCYDIYLEDL